MSLRLPTHIPERWLLIGLLLLAVLAVSRGTAAMGGAAPHYLAATDSLVRDFDLDLTNQYDPAGGYVFYPGAPAAHVRRGRLGYPVPAQGIGISVLMVPVYAVGQVVAAVVPDAVLERVRWSRVRLIRDFASLFIAFLYAYAAVLALRCIRAFGDTAGTGYREWAVVIGFATPPIVTMSLVVFPEMAIGFLTMVFMYGMVTGKAPRASTWALALIPWFGLRYLPITLAGLFWASRPGDHEPRPLQGALASVAASLLGLGLYGLWLHGGLLPLTNFDRGVPLAVGHGIRSAIGLLMDPDFGLLVVAPFWVIALAGIKRMRASATPYLLFLAIAGSGTFLAAAFTQEWWGGYSPAARLLMPVLPAATPLLAAGLSTLTGGWQRLVGGAAVGWALLLSCVLIIEPVSLWTDTTTGRGLTSPNFAAALVGSNRNVETGSEEDTGIIEREPLIVAAQRGAAGRVQAMLAEGADPDTLDGRGLTPLMHAASGEDVRTIRTLVEGGADLNAVDKDGWSALTFAIQLQAGDALTQLLRAGAELDTVSRLGWTPLMIASYAGYAPGVRALVRAQADVNLQTHGGMTALIRAAQVGNVDVLRLLLGAGADTSATAEGRTAEQWATLLYHDEAAALLRSRTANAAVVEP